MSNENKKLVYEDSKMRVYQGLEDHPSIGTQYTGEYKQKDGSWRKHGTFNASACYEQYKQNFTKNHDPDTDLGHERRALTVRVALEYAKLKDLDINDQKEINDSNFKPSGFGEDASDAEEAPAEDDE